ncbi:hypothetical protein [Macrococcus equipercicus]|uniref:FTP domain-containing protein n=1 Tax=Macrococcus equipercicus TaxID=69967 RepID=A0A9Q9F315_9STAP|nr:hypothetical protein [Macrococcus equipercicus]UTH14966.1 hypothetical protein KFV11_11605 [Macrococcus equipercicus]
MRNVKILLALFVVLLGFVSTNQLDVYAKVGPNQKFYNSIEQNQAFKKQMKNAKFDMSYEKNSIKIVKNSELKNFNNDVAIVQGKIKGKDITVAAIINANNLEVYSYTLMTVDDQKKGYDLKEYDGKTGELLLHNHIDKNGNVQNALNPGDNQEIRSFGIKPGSFWWKVICNLAVSGQCSLGCLALIEIPGGPPVCAAICASMGGAAAC